MAHLPTSLKVIQPFLTKAEEMKNADPIVAYYCTYWAVQYGISLSSKDPESNLFLGSLLDSLEKSRSNLAGNEAITDDVVGKAYMENFATNIFTKADDEERSKKATKATATKFLAAAYFMEVLRGFGDLDKETSDKIKYAKYQCSRILKALKAGEDPNAKDPVDEEESIPVLPYVSPAKQSPSPLVPAPIPPVIPSQSMTGDTSYQLHSSIPSIPPIEPQRPDPNDLFAMSFNSQNDNPPPPGAPPLASFFPSNPSPPVPPRKSSPSDIFSSSFPPNPYSPTSPAPPTQFAPADPPNLPYASPTQPQQAPSNYYPPPPAPQQRHPPPSNYSTPSSAYVAPNSQYYSGHISQAPSAFPAPSTSSYFPPQPQVTVDDEAIAKAQKHARWAISALNYDDVQTAIKELKSALSTLGAN